MILVEEYPTKVRILILAEQYWIQEKYPPRLKSEENLWMSSKEA